MGTRKIEIYFNIYQETKKDWFHTTLVSTNRVLKKIKKEEKVGLWRTIYLKIYY